ncbi:MAG: hypothetical protein ABFD98_10150 [Syntrophobacteraceae bacterium]
MSFGPGASPAIAIHPAAGRESVFRFFFDPLNPVFPDHFPGYPVIPGSLLLACMQRAAEWRNGSTTRPAWRLTGIRNARFIRFGRPGWVNVEVDACAFRDGGAVIFSCLAVQEGEALASAVLCYEKT